MWMEFFQTIQSEILIHQNLSLLIPFRHTLVTLQLQTYVVNENSN